MIWYNTNINKGDNSIFYTIQQQYIRNAGEQYICGIDAGLNGGFFVIDKTNELLQFASTMPKVRRERSVYTSRIGVMNVLNYINETYNKNVTFILEYCSYHKTMQDRMNMNEIFNFGKNYGVVESCVANSGNKYMIIKPLDWKKYFELNNEKYKSVELSDKLYYTNDGTKNVSRRYVDEYSYIIEDGIAESSLIALFGKKILSNVIDNKSIVETNIITLMNKGE